MARLMGAGERARGRASSARAGAGVWHLLVAGLLYWSRVSLHPKIKIEREK